MTLLGVLKPMSLEKSADWRVLIVDCWVISAEWWLLQAKSIRGYQKRKPQYDGLFFSVRIPVDSSDSNDSTNSIAKKKLQFYPI